MSILYYVLRIVHTILWLLEIAVIVEVILSYFMSPWHPIRQFISRIVGPLLVPIRRIVPSLGGFDFSPLILIILIQLVDRLIYSTLG
jgi:YggT family protein